MRSRDYTVLDRAVAEGVTAGLRRVFKHGDKVTEDRVLEEIQRSVMDSISEVFEFDETMEATP